MLTRIPPNGSTRRGPTLAIMAPIKGVNIVETIKPTEKVAATVPLDHPNSSRMGGKSREKEVRAFTPIPIVIKATTTTIHP